MLFTLLQDRNKRPILENVIPLNRLTETYLSLEEHPPRRRQRKANSSDLKLSLLISSLF